MTTEADRIEELPTPAIKSEVEDLSIAIEQSVPRQAGEEVHCVHLFRNSYRCNWRATRGADDVIGRIIRSKFFRATRTADGLVIEDLTHVSPVSRKYEGQKLMR